MWGRERGVGLRSQLLLRRPMSACTTSRHPRVPIVCQVGGHVPLRMPLQPAVDPSVLRALRGPPFCDHVANPRVQTQRIPPFCGRECLATGHWHFRVHTACPSVLHALRAPPPSTRSTVDPRAQAQRGPSF